MIASSTDILPSAPPHQKDVVQLDFLSFVVKCRVNYDCGLPTGYKIIHWILQNIRSLHISVTFHVSRQSLDPPWVSCTVSQIALHLGEIDDVTCYFLLLLHVAVQFVLVVAITGATIFFMYILIQKSAGFLSSAPRLLSIRVYLPMVYHNVQFFRKIQID